MGLTEVNQSELDSTFTLAQAFESVVIGNDFLRLKHLKNHPKTISRKFETMGGPEKGRVSEVI